MSFILTADLDSESTPGSCLRRYHEYLAQVRGRMSATAFDLARSMWWHSFEDHRAPHDARLENVTVSEKPIDDPRQERNVMITVRLLSAYQDGFIDLNYKGVRSYRLELVSNSGESSFGLQDWRYDEFRLSAEGRFEHEIEWWGSRPTGTWIIEAGDIEHSWHPITR